MDDEQVLGRAPEIAKRRRTARATTTSSSAARVADVTTAGGQRDEGLEKFRS